MIDQGSAGGGILFLKWFPYDKRNETISAALGAECSFVSALKKRSVWNAPLRYLLQAVQTLLLLRRKRPGTVLVTNPPIFAAATVALYCAWSGARYIIDAHSGALASKWRLFGALHRLLARRASLVIVTNAAFERTYRAWGAQTRIIGDLIMEIPRLNRLELGQGFHVAVVCSFDPDEPLAEILAAAAGLPEVSFLVTGNYRRLDQRLLEGRPPNLAFTGFLPDQEYFDLLHACDAVMVLVDQEDTMQQGAYEAVSVKKPMILSDWNLLRETYPWGAVFVKNDPASIQEGVRLMMERYPFFCAGMERLQLERARIWEENRSFLAGYCAGGRIVA